MARNHERWTRIVLALMVSLPLLTTRAWGQNPALENKGKQQTIAGYMRDVAYLMRHPDVLKPSNDCAVMCARDGSPLVIASKTGELYLPISSTIPDQSLKERLTPLVGKYVRATGRVFQRSGMQAIAIEHIEAVSE
jgi:hypothetical protein